MWKTGQKTREISATDNRWVEPHAKCIGRFDSFPRAQMAASSTLSVVKIHSQLWWYLDWLLLAVSQRTSQLMRIYCSKRADRSQNGTARTYESIVFIYRTDLSDRGDYSSIALNLAKMTIARDTSMSQCIPTSSRRRLKLASMWQQ